MIVLDTHVLVWSASDDRKLGRKARGLLDRFWAAGQVAVPAIVFWEIGLLQARRKLALTVPVGEWRLQLLSAGAVELALDGEVAIRALDLAGLSDDPADRFIVATALTHAAMLLTADDKLLAWSHPLVRHDARL